MEILGQLSVEINKLRLATSRGCRGRSYLFLNFGCHQILQMILINGLVFSVLRLFFILRLSQRENSGLMTEIRSFSLA